jgi:hypothetical protein
LGGRPRVVFDGPVSVPQVLLSTGTLLLYTQLKMEMLELIENHYLKLGLEIVPTLPALVPSVLLMIEENDEVIRLKTLSVIDNLVGVGVFHPDCGQQARQW